VLQGVAGCCRVLQGVTCCKVLQGTTPDPFGRITGNRKKKKPKTSSWRASCLLIPAVGCTLLQSNYFKKLLMKNELRLI